MSLAVAAFTVGKLIDDGKIRSLSEPLTTWFPEWQQGKKRQVTLRHLLEHTTGMTLPAPDDPLRPSNVWRFALAADVTDLPGSKRAFNPKASNLLSGLVQIAAGKKLDTYFDSAIVKPLGLRTPVWSYDAEQNPIVSGGLSWHAGDLAALGQAFIDGGPTDKGGVRATAKPDTTVFYVGDGRGSFWLIAPAKRLVAVRLSRTPLTDPRASLTALLPLLGLGGDPLKEPASLPTSQPTVKSLASAKPPSSQPVTP
jgi:CubicO group peptidase (beta-lactamase class C family)